MTNTELKVVGAPFIFS